MIGKYILILIVSMALLFLQFCGQDTGTPPGETGTLKNKNVSLQQPGKGHNHKHNLNRERQRMRGKAPELSGHSVVRLPDEVKERLRIKIITVKENPIQASLKAMGKVLAPRDGKAIVGYAFPGRIVKIHVSIGQWVKQGQPLVGLQCEEVGSAKAGYFKATAQYRLAKQNFEREERLFKKDIGAKKDYLQTRAQLQIVRSNLGAAQQKLDAMGFSPQQIKEIADGHNIGPHVTVNAPIPGRVIQNNAVLGAMIEPATEIMVVLDPTTLCIDAGIYEKDLAKIKTDLEVKISVPAYPGKTFVGRIYYIGDIVHPETRTITVRTRVANKDLKLKPGMFADIDILVDQRKKAVTVPAEAVLDDLEHKIIFVRQGDDYICRRVEVGPKFNGHIEIKNGLKIGETVVVEGNYQLKSKLYEENLDHAHAH